MSLTNGEFAAILNDETKHIEEDLTWTVDEDHSPAVEFRVNVHSTSGWPLFVKGRYNAAAGTLNYTPEDGGTHIRSRPW